VRSEKRERERETSLKDVNGRVEREKAAQQQLAMTDVTVHSCKQMGNREIIEDVM
jgi:hypothetical protein